MTAPAGLAEVTAQIASLQAQIDALSAPATTTDPTSAADFASALAGAGPAAATTDAATTTPLSAYAVPGATTTTASAATSTGTAPAVSAGGPTGADVVSDAKRYLGIPYVWGGESTSGLDCSGLVQKTFGDLGISLPRVAADQAHSGTPVASLADAQPGDLLFFGNPAYHVAIYAGNNQLIESPEPGKTVHITDVYQTPTSIRRIVPDAGTAGVTPAAAGTGLSSAQLIAAGVYPAVAGYATQFAAAEQTYGLPHGLLAAVAQQESGGNANAVSPAGAQGLMQLMPSTAAGQGVNAFDPGQAILAAARIFKTNLAQFHGSVPLALAAYNAGAGAVSEYGGIPPYSETQNYVTKIMATLEAGG